MKQGSRAPVKHKYILFSVILFVVIFTPGTLGFVSTMWKIRYAFTGRELCQAVEIEKLRLEAVLSGEVSLVLKMADSPLIQRYFLNPDDPALAKIAFEEFTGYQRAFASHSIFWVTDADKKYHFNETYVYPIDPDDPDTEWYYRTLNADERFNCNISHNTVLDVTYFWINAPVYDSNHRPIGIVGSGVDFSVFLNAVYSGYSGSALMIFFNEDGEITGTPDENLYKDQYKDFYNNLIKFRSSGKADLGDVMGKTGTAIYSLRNNLDHEVIQYFKLSGNVAALGAVPEFGWYICAILPFNLLDALNTPMTGLYIAMTVVIAAVFVIFNLMQANVELNREREVFRDMAITDALTEIYNRRFLEENMVRIIKGLSRSGGKLSLLMLDIDYFKKYNDTYGHNAGDICLRTVANTIAQSLVRTNDFVARYGGEEFVVVLPNADAEGARLIAEKMLANIRERNIPHEKSDVASCVTVSIGGVTDKVAYSHTGEYYFKKADQALYASKQSGRNRYTATSSTPAEILT